MMNCEAVARDRISKAMECRVSAAAYSAHELLGIHPVTAWIVFKEPNREMLTD